MFMRDYFAAKAMQGLLSARDNHINHLEQVARLAYEIADGMLIARAEDE
jgi:HD superfamily phosphodiesterase